MKRLLSVLILYACMSANMAQAARDIVLLSGTAGKVTISDFDGTVEITDGDSNTFVFACYDSNDPNIPMNIESITVDPNATGTVTISILPEPGYIYGAAAVKKIDLTAAGVTGRIEEMIISGDLGETAGVECDDVIDDITIGGNVLNTFDAGDVDSGATITITKDLEGTLTANTLGNLTIGGPDIGAIAVGGDIAIAQDFDGTITIDHKFGGTIQIGNPGTTLSNLGGTIAINGNFQSPAEIIVAGDVEAGAAITLTTFCTGVIDIDGDLAGTIYIDDQLTKPGRISIGGDVSQASATIPAILINKYISGTPSVSPESAMITVTGELGGVIAINEDLRDAVNGPEIQVGSVATGTGELGAVAIDYDGWLSGHEWEAGATIKVGATEYGGNTPSLHLYEITECKGDMNNDGVCDPNDDSNTFYLAVDYPSQYAAGFPGLAGSMDWHGDVNQEDGFNINDEGAMLVFSEMACCAPDEGTTDYDNCRADFDASGDVALADLQLLLAAYGSARGDGTYNPRADLDDDDDVELADLQLLLSVYGNACTCPNDPNLGGLMGGMQMLSLGGITAQIAAVDTSGHSETGFVGEVDHFVFDLNVTLASGDDWTTAGVTLTPESSAALRLATTATTVDQYATFVTTPRLIGTSELRSIPTTYVAGAYSPSDADAIFTAGAANLAWYDRAASHDGPATILRIVLDVSQVEDANVSSGFGSVYFTTGATRNAGDIRIATIEAQIGSTDNGDALTTLTGYFYVNGD